MICGACGIDKPADEMSRAEFYGRRCKSCNRDRVSVRKHGLTAQQKSDIAAAQGGCAICGHSEPSAKGWVVDHDHDCCPGEKSCTKCRRGVICAWCNGVLGNAFDRPQILQAAIAYLERHASGICDWHMPLACSERICGKSGLGTMHGRTENTYGESLVTSESESHVTQRARAGQENPLAAAVSHA